MWQLYVLSYNAGPRHLLCPTASNRQNWDWSSGVSDSQAEEEVGSQPPAQQKALGAEPGPGPPTQDLPSHLCLTDSQFSATCRFSVKAWPSSLVSLLL